MFYQAWQTALSILGDRPLIIDISFVHRCGRLRQCAARALAQERGANHRGVTRIAGSGRADYRRSDSYAVTHTELVTPAECHNLQALTDAAAVNGEHANVQMPASWPVARISTR